MSAPWFLGFSAPRIYKYDGARDTQLRAVGPWVKLLCRFSVFLIQYSHPPNSQRSPIHGTQNESRRSNTKHMLLRRLNIGQKGLFLHLCLPGKPPGTWLNCSSWTSLLPFSADAGDSLDQRSCVVLIEMPPGGLQHAKILRYLVGAFNSLERLYPIVIIHGNWK